MRNILWVGLISVLLVALTGCAVQATALPSPTPSAAPIAAIYLVDGPGQLSAADLQAHPQVQVAHTFAALQQQAQAHPEAALWIDKNAVPLVEMDWLHAEPQKWTPLALIGYNNPLYSFREVLNGFGIEGPYVDWSQETLEPGFSLWVLLEESESGHSAVFRGYPGQVSVEAVLAAEEKVNSGQ